MLNLAAGLAFSGFLVLAILAGHEARGAGPSRYTGRLIAYAAVVSLAAGLTGRDLWPFSAWRMMRWTSPDTVSELRLVGVDASGREYPVDYRAWQPLSLEELTSWLERVRPTLPIEAQDSAAGYLLGLANRAREAAASGHSFGVNRRFLGPLAAPTHLLHPEHWKTPSDVPTAPFTRLRVLRESWNVTRGRAADGGVTRSVELEFPRP